jgi:hypothetical protein
MHARAILFDIKDSPPGVAAGKLRVRVVGTNLVVEF